MAATLVGGAFLTSTLDVLFDRLASKEFINFFRGRKLNESLLKELKRKVLVLNKLLNDAEDKQITDRAVKEWLDELKGAVYDAEDLVDEIATQALRCKVEAEYQSGSNQVQSLISSFTKLFDDEIESKLEKMIDTLEDFSKEKDVLGLREVAGRNWSQTRLPTTSLVDESCVYGRENDKDEIMKLLLSDGENKIDVIPIVGMGGVGKTTLAQLLYNDGRVVAHFEKKAWVCVSDLFDVLRVTKTIVEKVIGGSCEANDLDSLHVKLKESLSGKKFLIVLDDVWNENCDNWNTLMTPFKFGEHGSKIIVTTRNDGVASIMQTGVPIHRLHELPEEDCWELFSQHAFEKGDCNEHPNLVKIGKEIVRKCDGLPLAVKTLGGLLRSQRDVKDWNKILESAIWELSKEKSNILPALRLSYHYLPSHLKRCFAFCSIFIKDHEFDVKELVSIWMAEGFLVKPKNNMTVEEEGNEWFHELLSRSFFQRSSASNSVFVMHDLVHDLGQYVMGDFCYRLEDDKPCGTSENVRHFSYVQHGFYYVDKFQVIKDAKCLRTFLQIDPRNDYRYRTTKKKWLSNKVLDEIISGMSRLRLLSLSQYEFEELPYSIGKLIHLRFLNLSHSQITQLPESVCTLYNLETLLLFNCNLLTALPADIGKLISLRRLDLSDHYILVGTNLKEMPVSISRLKDLQQLTDFVVGKCSGSGINGLRELNSLRGAITISGLENVTSGDDASEAKLKEKKHLKSLTLRWGSTTEDSQKERDVLENLEPHTNLEILDITNYGGTTLPADLGKLISLRRLDLSRRSFGTNLKEMPVSISRLKDLQQLTNFVVGKCSGSGINGLKELNSLCGAITISGLENVTSGDDASEAKLKEKKHLELLTLRWGSTTEDSQKERDVLENLEPHTNLKRLKITNYGGTRFPNWLGDKSFCNMELLWLDKCENCFSLPPLSQMPSLESLMINDCPEIETFSEGDLPSGLTFLRIWKCEKLKSLPKQLHTVLPSLHSLQLSDCPEIESFPEGGLPSKLVYLGIRSCKKLVGGRRDWGLRTLPSLTNFSLDGESEDVLESFPEEGLLPPTLTYLSFGNMPNLKSLNGRGLQPLVSLKSMLITDCPQLQSLSVERLPTSLSELTIWRCPLLEPCCRREEGEDWHKIDPIRFIRIEGKVISETISNSH